MILIAIISLNFEISFSKENVQNNIPKKVLNQRFKTCTKKNSFKKCYRALNNIMYESLHTSPTRSKYIDNYFNYDSVGSQNLIWNDGNGSQSASGCNFFGNDLKNVNSMREDCSEKCKQTKGCTHYTWTNGTCWMKKGLISKSDTSQVSGDYVCGILYIFDLFPPQTGKLNLHFFGPFNSFYIIYFICVII